MKNVYIYMILFSLGNSLSEIMSTLCMKRLSLECFTIAIYPILVCYWYQYCRRSNEFPSRLIISNWLSFIISQHFYMEVNAEQRNRKAKPELHLLKWNFLDERRNTLGCMDAAKTFFQRRKARKFDYKIMFKSHISLFLLVDLECSR
jgi:hypothetical protein